MFKVEHGVDRTDSHLCLVVEEAVYFDLEFRYQVGNKWSLFLHRLQTLMKEQLFIPIFLGVITTSYFLLIMHDPLSTMPIYIGRLEFSIELVWSCGQNVQSWVTSAQHRARFESWGYHLYVISVSHGPICFYLVDCQSIHTSKGKEIMILLDVLYIHCTGRLLLIHIDQVPPFGWEKLST